MMVRLSLKAFQIALLSFGLVGHPSCLNSRHVVVVAAIAFVFLEAAVAAAFHDVIMVLIVGRGTED